MEGDTGATLALASFALASRPLAESRGVLAPARRAILDTLGVGLAGSCERVAEIVRGYVVDQQASGASGVWGSADRTSTQLAALANATSAHALDFDDISHSMRGRPSAAVLPAVLAIAERVHASGAALLEAYIVAVEVECKLGQLSADASYERGWQTSCTLGAVATAVGCGRLLGLDVSGMGHAIGLAVAQASGSRRGFGSMAKPVQVGHASQAGVLAAELAARGVSGGERALEGEAGYFDLYAEPVDASGLAALLGHPYDLEQPGFNVKLYPCGGAAHAPIEALFAAAEGVTAEQVARIVVDVPFTAPRVAHHHRPATPLEAKFSLEYCLAAALLDRQVGFEQFTAAAVNRPEVQDLSGRVAIRVPPDMQKGAVPWPPEVESRVELHLRDGQVRRGVTVVRRGQGTRTPLSDGELEAKFVDCARRAGRLESGRRVMGLVHGLELLADSADLVAALAH